MIDPATGIIPDSNSWRTQSTQPQQLHTPVSGKVKEILNRSFSKN
ncbi:unnamed protein product [Brugia timori]|uniref:Uncharacterized protein n=1 Tax=Brugia timori TaxID=42155 RepID=A0A0R3QYG3_9BILA|nr:unnamed protein product [Brugia timori]